MKLELHIPGLLAVPARLQRAIEAPSRPYLAQWHARASSWQVPRGRHGFLCEALGVRQAPLAALAWLGAAGERAAGSVLFATPVHLQAGMDDLVLFAGKGLEISAEELQAVADDLVFPGGEPAVALAAGCLFLLSPEPLAVNCAPLHSVQGRAIGAMLPTGGDAQRVNRWINEMQMLLHDHPVNREREAAGMPTLNGLWPWGEGELPQDVPGKAATVHARSAEMLGLGRLLGEAREYAGLGHALAGDGRQVIEIRDGLDALDADDVNAWREAVATIDRDILAPVMAWLETRPGAEAVLYAGDGLARRLVGGRQGIFGRLLRRLRATGMPRPTEE